MIPLRDNIAARRFPFINWLLIAANIYVFFLMVRLPSTGLQAFVNQWAVIPKLITASLPEHAVRLVTAMFLHGGWMHLFSNMLYLFIFGDNVEDRMGHTRYLIFYFVAGVAANYAQVFINPTSTIPMIGASGAVAGVLGSYFFFYPHAKVLTLIPIAFFITIREIPAFFLLGLWFIMQTFNGTAALSAQLITKETVGGIAWWAHAAGFIAGIILSPAMGARSKGRFT